MTIALYLLIGAVYATGGWFYALGRVEDFAWNTRGYVLGWLFLWLCWPVILSYCIVDAWVER